MQETSPESLDDLRKTLEDQIEEVAQLGLYLAALQGALLKKGLLTESEIDAAGEEVTRQSRAEIARIEEAMRKRPGGVQ